MASAICSKDLLSEPLDTGGINQIQVVLARGNPEYGADSKIITNRTEIEKLVKAFNGATIGHRVADGDLAVVHASRYYSDGSRIRALALNERYTERTRYNLRWHYLTHPGQRSYDLYRTSGAESFHSE